MLANVVPLYFISDISAFPSESKVIVLVHSVIHRMIYDMWKGQEFAIGRSTQRIPSSLQS